MPESDLVKFDLEVTVSAMRYISDLHIGRVNPRLFHFGLDIDHKKIDLSEFFTQKLVGATDVDAVLQTVEPPFPIYRRTQDALKKYMEFARIDDGELLPVSSRAIKPGDSYAGVPRLAKLLALLGIFRRKWGGLRGRELSRRSGRCGEAFSTAPWARTKRHPRRANAKGTEYSAEPPRHAASTRHGAHAMAAAPV